jgi:O-antigen ligase
VGALVLALAALSLKATRMLMVGAWTIVTLLAVPLGALPYDFDWERWTWLPPESVAARFYIWKYVADHVYERPIVGIGIRGTRALHLKIPVDAGDPSHSTYALQGREARHPHNVFLQTWLELGAIGAVLLLGVGLPGLWPIRNWPPLLQGSGYALFAVGCAVGVSGFDLADLAPCRAGVRLGRDAARVPSSRARTPARDTSRLDERRRKSCFTCNNSLID